MFDFSFIADPLGKMIAEATHPDPTEVVNPGPLGAAWYVLDKTGKGLGFFAETDVVPRSEASQNDAKRPVSIACHPVGSFGGLLKDQMDQVEKATGQAVLDPSYHWAVIVGDYYHELNPKGLSTGDIIGHIQNGYRNGQLSDGKDWSHQKHVGFTTFNDAAIVAAGHAAIKAMDEPYNVITNNCQKFVIGLVHLISPTADLSDIQTAEQVIEYIMKHENPDEAKKHVDLIKMLNVPAVNATSLMQVATPVM